ncbi:MAG: beta-N-acetylhexosaminidase, partial [Candidatus Solibacter sp.]|nr:beta-N-acetylhexosaminidase [Candidatus Solibacter sp.]
MLRPTLLLPPLLFTIACVCLPAAPPDLMPYPARVTPGRDFMAIDSSFRVAVEGFSDARLEGAIRRSTDRVFRQTGIIPAVRPGGRPTLLINCHAAGPLWPALGEDESYQLEIGDNHALLSAATVTGVLRGMATFVQLIAPGPDGFRVPAIHIEDHPRFPWRGLMLDVARHWMPPQVVLRNLDAMAAVKLNVFHWHLSDDQGFRVESKLFPQLQRAGSDGNFYTQTQVREVVEYARDRGIRVIPEFDIPGHTTSWLAGMPELASAPGPYELQRRWGIFEPTLDPTREITYQVLDQFLGEMAALFPDAYFHIGGDEVDDAQWKQSAAIQAFSRQHHLADSRELHTYFNQRVQALLKKHGKIMIGWDEVLAPGLAGDTVIQSWRGQDSLADAARKGYRGVLSSGYYLDHLQPAGTHYAVDPLDAAARALNTDEAARILGGEACMWAEYVSPETVDSRIWPRMAAIAERFWSPREVNDTGDMYARLESVNRGLEWTGLRHRANYQPMLDRLAGARPSEPLRILADACEALGIAVRRDARKYTSLVDLNRFVDAVRPESMPVRNLEQSARRLGPADFAALRGTLHAWAENDAVLAPASGNVFLSELTGISRQLSQLAAIGLESLEYLQSGKTAPDNWVAEKNQALATMDRP